MKENLLAALPEIVLALGAMSMMMLGVFYKATAQGRMSTVARGSSVLIIIALAALSYTVGMKGSFFNNMFVMDGFALFIKAVLIFSAGMVLIMSNHYLEKNSEKIGFEYPILIMLSLCGMLMMVSANSLLSLYMSLELQSLSLYVLAAIRRDDSKASEAGVKYFVLGALASGIMLYGISLIYGFSGTVGLDELKQIISGSTELGNGMIIGLVLLVCGLCFKISAAPFHMWTPDVYEGVPTPVTAYFAIVPKLAVAAFLVRLLFDTFGSFVGQWQDIVIIISILSMSVGAFAGIWQQNIKRLLAYSSIANMGYALVGIAAFNESGVQALLIFMVIYMLSSIVIFAVILNIDVRDSDGEKGLEKIEHLNGFAKNNPITGMLIALVMFSMIGLPFPPFAGFFGKFFIFKSAIESDLYGLAVIGVIASVVAAYYYLRIVKVMYFDELGKNIRVNLDLEAHSKLIILMATLVSLFIFVYPGKFLEYAAYAAHNIF